MSLLIKICGLRETTHVEAAINAGADAIGFVFADSPRRIDPADAARLSALIPSSIKRVAVMRHPSPEEWQQVAEILAPDVLQTDAEDFATLDVASHIEQWPVYREGGDETPSKNMYVYEGRQSGKGETVSWPAAAELASSGKMILAGGLTPANVGAAVLTVRPFGVDVSSGVESSRGIKSAQRIQDFITATRMAETQL